MANDAVGAWIEVADRDIDAVHNNLFGPRPNAGVAAYHCQQAAEKLVKALLLAAGTNPPKSHDVGALIDRLPSGHPLFAAVDPLRRLTPFVSAHRYPGADPFGEPPDDPTVADVTAWLTEIEAVRAEVERFLNP